ncbi:chromatin remodeling factor mit1 [Aspergillus lentulus]|uniref:Chromatin remodeling factor mit1 n=1 Tax=Aspergillus lentulus TaxID=293939 RepID=A0ABQ0ZQP4_ASPLE|nr:chromatin remodeling factor mit1 [Aspergillus lentulus]GFF22704.1 chromatin remodeling factor mit1 [Aspergillus lentulus]GFF60772.1 chromatin remodeling factor mit1 [Aspergillus lentulus]GFF62254.1 chromatin remodeling factor mit1 [Aspergillus lentulus]GFF63789.1 chromatin remodeling factor mit1 [Aspergillus lentulus]GFF97945.1 chromatin remodeling factor mit1 [Aspergillus lentulus]
MELYYGTAFPSKGDDENEDLVADLLVKFNGSHTTHTQRERPQSTLQQMPQPGPQQASQQEQRLSPDPMPREMRLAAVEIPPIANPEEYEFLPGHFAVRSVISEISHPLNEPSYRVRLRSGESDIVTFSHLQTLENGPEALLHFQNTDYHSSSPTTSHITLHSSDKEDVESGTRSRRSRRTKKASFTDFFGPLSSDEDEPVRDASSDDIISSSAITSRTRRLRRRVHNRVSRRSRQSSSESENAEPRGERFSTRQRKTLRRNLRERMEDDISEKEDSSREKRFVGAKETFQKIPSEDAFRLRHNGICEVCGLEGDDGTRGLLVFCQGCTSAYHQTCLGPRSNRDHLVTKVADEQFVLQCRRCIGVSHAKDPISPHQGCCMKCNDQGKMSKPLRERLTPKQEQQIRQDNDGKDPITPVDMTTVNNVDNVLFRCTACHRAFHFEHLPPVSDTADNPATARFEEYSYTWKCHDCSSVPGEIGALVAWRPADTTNHVAGYTADGVKEVDKEYLIKWKGHSYHHTSWMPGSWVWGIVSPAMRRAFFRSEKNFQPHMTIEEAIPEDFLRVDIVFQVYYSEEVEERTLESDLERIHKVTRAYVKFKGLPYEEAEWDSPPDPSQTERWNDFKAAYEDWVRRDYIHMPEPKALQKHLVHIRKQNFKSQIVRDAQPDTVTGGQLMDYQKDGVNWLYYMWFKQQNAILADEMGLGKTIQVIAFFATLIQYHKCWPFLVVVPNSTCPNWRKEIKSWVPSIRVVTYYGSAFARKLAQEHEMFSQGEPDLRCHVVVTSYETMIDDASRRVLMKIPWAGLVVDEGQRLKNDKSQIYESLSRFKFPFKLLLTGTPLQNNTRELFNLLQFCDPTKDAAKLDEEYGTLSKENIPELHNMIRPFFLRRTKAQVLTFLPPMAQIIVPVSMSVVQKKLYKSILAKNPQLIKAIFQRNSNSEGVKQADRHNLNNILMQLRKCLCHPFVYSEAIEERTANAAASHKHLVEASGKLKLLEIMLPKLKQRGHRVLIFSQFLDNLDIVEDFLDGLGLLHRRLDGRMTSLEKQKRIDEYNADNSPYFAFLLSTRSGGVGINLATADTVIIMDPDFNPHQDMQALSRAHRIGQKNKVLVFQLMTRGSVEEKIMQIGKKKMVLDHVLIDRMVAEEDDGRDLESILRHGAQALFNDDDSGDVHYNSESVDKLLDRSQEEQAKTPDESAPESQFSFARIWANDNQNLEGKLQDTEDKGEDPAISNTLWEKILQEREQAAAEEARRKAEMLGRGKRKRAAVDYGKDTTDASPVKVRREADNDVEYKADEVIESESDHDPEMDSYEMDWSSKKSKVRPFKRIAAEEDGVPAYGATGMDGNVEARHPPCFVCAKHHPAGSCPLKQVGVEHCGLCGLAHYGFARTCPHLRSETQVARMLDALKHSTEDRELIEKAKKYLQGIRGSLAQRRRKLASRATASQASNGVPGTTNTDSTGSPVIDLTGYPAGHGTMSFGPSQPGQRFST